jgi:hypothetical protein
MKRIQVLLGAVLLALAMPSVAQAQTHPCDAAAVSPEVRPGVAFSVGFCFSGKDAEGNPVVVDVFKVTIDSAPVFSATIAPTGAPNAAGLSFYQTPKTLTVATQGNHSVIVVASGPGGDSPSGPLVFVVKALAPSPPLNLRIVK